MTTSTAIAKIKEVYGPNPKSYKVISFIQSNWEDITGTDESEMYAEQEFSDETLTIIEAFGIDYDTLCESW